MAETSAQLNRLRIPPRKVRLVAGLLRGKDVIKALHQLEHLVKRPAPYLKKLIDSAVASAENNFNMVKDNLYIKELIVNEGVKLKRFKAKGFGRSSEIQKKTSHIKIILAERVAGIRADKKSTTRGGSELKEEDLKAKQEQIKKPEVKTEIGKKGSKLGNFGKRLFRRKVI